MTARHALRLHVGCGLEVLPDWVNADVEPIPGAIRADVHSLPLRDSTFDYVLASHLLEHIPDVKRAITELARVLRPGGTLEIRVPDYRHEYFAEGSEKYRHRYPVLFTRVRVEEVRGHGPYPFLPRLLGYFPRMDRLFRDRFGGPIELRFYCVKR
jgi:SAM-dependent methyltransferase